VTVAHADVRIALSAGLISAALTIGGPCIAAASADPGHSGTSHSKHDGDSHRDRQYDRDGQSGSSRNDDRYGDRDDDRRGDDGGRRGGDSYQRGDDRDGWEGRTGWEGGYADARAKGGYAGPGGYQVASRPSAQPSTTSRNTTITGAATPEQVPLGGEPGGGAVPQGGLAAPVEAPRVTFGNGRTPGVLKTAPGRTATVNPAPAPSAPAPPPPPAPESPAAALMAIEPESQEFIDRIWAPLRPTFGSGLLFGLAGLVIMPLSGIWLGYRQARAAKSADAARLIRH
jgi:hypothetical protein